MLSPVSMGFHIMSILSSTPSLLVALLVFASGCGATNKPPPLVDLRVGTNATSPEGNAEPGTEILIWGRTDEGPNTTYRVADGSGRVMSEEPGTVIMTSHGEIVWHDEQVEITTAGCSFDETPVPPGFGTITRAWLEPRGGGTRQKVVDPGDFKDSEVKEIQHSVSLLGSVGPYLFVHEDSYTYACGAHGGVIASFLMWDVNAGAMIEMMSEMPGKEALAKSSVKLLNEATGEEGSSDDLPELTQIMPTYAGRGAMHIDAQFTRFACYACSDGNWSSYTQSVRVPTEWMPPKLSAWVTPPVAVKEFLQAHPKFTLGGWSKK